MNPAIAAIAAAPGLALGSFLNVVATRVPEKASIGTSRSVCAHCEAPIRWYDNVPLLSFALLRGRCRDCKERISPLYPAVELASAVLVATAVAKFGLTPEMGVAAAFCLVLVVLSAIDVTHRIVPNKIVVPAAAAALVAQTALHPSPEWAIASASAFTGFLLFALAKPGGLGMGDVKLAALLGAVLGRDVMVGLMLGLLLSIVPTLVLFARHGMGARKMAIPFVPFLAAGSLIALFFGDALLGGYTGLFD